MLGAKMDFSRTSCLLWAVCSAATDSAVSAATTQEPDPSIPFVITCPDSSCYATFTLIKSLFSVLSPSLGISGSIPTMRGLQVYRKCSKQQFPFIIQTQEHRMVARKNVFLTQIKPLALVVINIAGLGLSLIRRGI